MAERAVLVIGGGIAGIQAALDLGSAGVKVHLVEKEPSIGGRMAQLDKTFPTNDCSMCILAPKMVDCFYNENVEIHTYTEVESVKGKAGDFEVTILRKPRYVDEKKCTGCGQCSEKCPSKVANGFNMSLDQRKAIYIPFPQAIPKVAVIDADHCIYLKKGKCQACVKVCQADAIDHSMKSRKEKIKVGAIIVATGFEPYMPAEMTEYGYGRIPNIVTAMEFERLINASGPTGGHLHRLSEDGRDPKRLAFIQCVGSRDISHGRPYCSTVCCMHATKEAMLAREHDAEVEATIFYTDLRPFGKGFNEYMARAEEDYGVRYIRAKPGGIAHDPATGDLLVSYLDPDSRTVRAMKADMVVLSTALIPTDGIRALGDRLGIDVDEHGFIHIPDPLGTPLETSTKGIYAAGYCQGPKDIPDSVAQASGAAASAMRLLLSTHRVVRA